MSTTKTKEEIKILREGGERLARILLETVALVKPEVSTDVLNEFAERSIRKGGDTPAFLNYTPEGAERPYPAALCVSINDEVVHGIPNEDPQILKEGDIVGLDLGLVHGGLITDSAVTVPVGNVDEKAQQLIAATKQALEVAITAARGGGHVGDIGEAVEKFGQSRGYGVPYELGGHGVGYKVHESPHVPNVSSFGKGEELMPGMVLALEPMLNEGAPEVVLQPDGYTFKTADGSRSAHFEHTIVITDGSAEIITKE